MALPILAFDLDGTLSDWEAAIRAIEPVHGERLLEVLDARHPRQDGDLVDGAHYLLFVEGEDIWAEVLGPDGDAAAASERFMAEFRAIAYDEVDAVLTTLGHTYRLVLVTNSPRASSALADMDLAHHFDEVVELPPELRKPKVEGFWYAAAQLGVEPGELLYVGDSYRCDIEAGVAAGVRPIWVDRWATRLPVPEGVIRVTDLAALPSALA